MNAIGIKLSNIELRHKRVAKEMIASVLTLFGYSGAYQHAVHPVISTGEDCEAIIHCNCAHTWMNNFQATVIHILCRTYLIQIISVLSLVPFRGWLV